MMSMNDMLRVYSWDDIVGGTFPTRQQLATAGYEGTALTVGGFDGVHLGHQALFSAVLAQKGFLPGVVTFGISPKARLNPAGFSGAVCTMEQRLQLFREAGFAFVVVIDFSGDFGRMDGVVFLQHLRDRLCMGYLAEGTDFRCGYKGSVNIDSLRVFCQDSGVRLDVVEPVIVEGVRVSSSEIRRSLQDGDFARCRRLLGRNFSLGGCCFDWTWSGDSLLGTRRRGSCGCMQIEPPAECYRVRVHYGTDGTDGAVSLDGTAIVREGVVEMISASPVDFTRDGLWVDSVEFMADSRESTA